MYSFFAVKLFSFFFLDSLLLTLTEANKTCSALNVVLDLFVTSWVSHQCALDISLLKHCTMSPFVDNDTHQSVRNWSASKTNL